MSGWYAMKRGWLEHEIFQPEARWSKAEAWVWLVESACFKPTKIDIGGKPYTVPRGSLCYSRRFLAAKWRWSETAVETFLKQLEAHGVAKRSVAITGPSRKQRRNQITLSNYDLYQFGKTTSQEDEKPQQNHNRTKEEQGNKDITLDANASKDADASAEPVEISILSKVVWGEGKRYLERHGVKNPGGIIGKWLKASPHIDVAGAIEAAQKAGTQDPVPYITEILKPTPQGVSNLDRMVQEAFRNA